MGKRAQHEVRNILLRDAMLCRNAGKRVAVERFGGRPAERGKPGHLKQKPGFCRNAGLVLPVKLEGHAAGTVRLAEHMIERTACLTEKFRREARHFSVFTRVSRKNGCAGLCGGCEFLRRGRRKERYALRRRPREVGGGREQHGSALCGKLPPQREKERCFAAAADDGGKPRKREGQSQAHENLL